MNYEIKQLKGVTTIFAHMAEANSTTIEIMVKAGSIYETRETNGISHFLEHMFFKGGKKYATPQVVAETVDQFWGEFNAYTGDEYAGYYVKCAPEHIHKAVDVLADMLIDAQFPKEELEREKGVVIQEIKMYEDMPHKLVIDKRKEFYYGDNSYGRSTLGPASNIQTFSQDMLHKHKNDLYTKDNLIIVVAGNISKQAEIEEQIGELFDKLPNTFNSTKPHFDHIFPTNNVGLYDKGTEQNHLVISAKGYTLAQEERFAANLLGVILGGNMSSRLFQNIREKKGLCYYISASHSSETDDGVFFMRAGIEKARFDFGLEAIYEEIAQIAAGNISQDEFTKALGYLTGQTQMGIESSDELASFIGNQYLLKKSIESLTEILEHYKKLTLSDVLAVCEKLKRENLYLYYIK